MEGRIEVGVLAVDLGFAAGRFETDEVGFDGADTVQAPEGGDHFVDEGPLDPVGGLVGGLGLVLELLKFTFAFTFEDQDMARG